MDIQRKYGVDVASVRADDLDRRMIADVSGLRKTLQGTSDVPCNDKGVGRQVSVLDLGCGGGGQSLRLAVAGASVLAIDVIDYTDTFKALLVDSGLPEDMLEFVQGGMSHLKELLGERGFDCVCFQRTIHYVPYKTALEVLRDLRARMNEGGKLYIAVTGLESDIGLRYDDADKFVQDRFCRLSESDAETFNITEPVCLYTPEEFIGLLQESGWHIEECWVSAFGNIKTICT